jgi:hypothetical protein
MPHANFPVQAATFEAGVGLSRQGPKGLSCFSATPAETCAADRKDRRLFLPPMNGCPTLATFFVLAARVRDRTSLKPDFFKAMRQREQTTAARAPSGP